MLSLNQFVCGLTAILMLSACASAVFPDFDDNEDDVEVSEGGRVVQNLPKEESSLKADTKNAAYEGEEDADKNDSEPAEKVEAAETKPIEAKELDEQSVDEPVAEEKVAMEQVEDSTPNLSYRVETIYFDNGSSAVDSKYNANLRNVVKMAKEHNAEVMVYGYASSRTRNTDPATHKLANFKVSMERAQNVADALKRAGVPANKISVQALSDSAPAYLEVMPEGERLNRRAEIYISY